MLEVCLALALVCFGWFLGRCTAKAEQKPLPPPSVEEQELRRLQEDRAAFATLMGYNAQVAYGADSEE